MTDLKVKAGNVEPDQVPQVKRTLKQDGSFKRTEEPESPLKGGIGSRAKENAPFMPHVTAAKEAEAIKKEEAEKTKKEKELEKYEKLNEILDSAQGVISETKYKNIILSSI